MPRLTKLTDSEYANGVFAEAKRINNNETIRKQPPTEQQVRLCLRVLRDFHIHINKDNIPKFKSVQELELWQKKMIHDKLYDSN